MGDIRLQMDGEFAAIHFDKKNSKVNVLTSPVMAELKGALREVSSRHDLKALFIISDKPGTFIAGADINEICAITDPHEAERLAKSGQDILNQLEELSIPSVALINGACLGGGLELSLACTYRLASKSIKNQIGLPEVKLGILPAFGGTKRLSRCVGLRKALEMIVSAKTVSSDRALKMGIVDRLSDEEKLFDEAKIFLKEINYRKIKHRPRLKGFLDILLDSTFTGRWLMRSQARRSTLKATHGHYPAALAALEVVSANYGASLRTSLDREAKEFARLVTGEVCKNLISVFFLLESYKKKSWVSVSGREVKRCGVIGAGEMGGGIAQLVSYYDVPVLLKDIRQEAIDKGLTAAKRIFQSVVRKKSLGQSEADRKMNLILPVSDNRALDEIDYVIEAVVEDLKIKQAVFKELSTLTRPQTILTTNTSSLSVDEMASVVSDSSRVVGMHFFNPPHKMPLVEVIRGAKTSPETIATVVQFSRRLGKTPVVVKNETGFLVNRILFPYLNEAGYLAEEGVGFERVDKALLQFGMPMGPFLLLDAIGLDVSLKVAHILENRFGERMKSAPLLGRMVEKKLLGKKTGGGFYLYEGQKTGLNPQASECVQSRALAMNDEEIIKRSITVMINEASLCLQEKVCEEVSDVDVSLILGIGFPPFRGGLLRYADAVGISRVVSTLESFQQKYQSDRFKPCETLCRLAATRSSFYPKS